jgi:hypothetical protein
VYLLVHVNHIQVHLKLLLYQSIVNQVQQLIFFVFQLLVQYEKVLLHVNYFVKVEYIFQLDKLMLYHIFLNNVLLNHNEMMVLNHHHLIFVLKLEFLMINILIFHYKNDFVQINIVKRYFV